MFTKGCCMTQGGYLYMNQTHGILCVHTFKKTGYPPVNQMEQNLRPKNVYS